MSPEVRNKRWVVITVLVSKNSFVSSRPDYFASSSRKRQFRLLPPKHFSRVSLRHFKHTRVHCHLFDWQLSRDKWCVYSRNRVCFYHAIVIDWIIFKSFILHGDHLVLASKGDLLFIGEVSFRVLISYHQLVAYVAIFVLMNVWQTLCTLLNEVAGINHVCDERVLIFLLILNFYRCEIWLQHLYIAIWLSLGSILDGQLPFRVISQSQKVWYARTDWAFIQRVLSRHTFFVFRIWTCGGRLDRYEVFNSCHFFSQLWIQSRLVLQVSVGLRYIISQFFGK